MKLPGSNHKGWKEMQISIVCKRNGTGATKDRLETAGPPRSCDARGHLICKAIKLNLKLGRWYLKLGRWYLPSHSWMWFLIWFPGNDLGLMQGYMKQ